MDTRSHETIRPAGAPAVDPYGPGAPDSDSGVMDRMSGFLHEKGAAGAVAEARDAGRRRPMMAATVALSAIAVAALAVFLIRR